MKKDTNRKAGSVLVVVMIVLAVIIVVTSTIAFGYHSIAGRHHNGMFCGVASPVPEE